MTYPITRSQDGSGLVVSGYRIVAPGFPDGYRVVVAGQNYELFADIVLISYNAGTYNYGMSYWYRPVELITGRWQPVPNSRRRAATVVSGQVTEFLGQQVTLTLLTESQYLPGYTSGANPSPASLGWVGSGEGISAGTPNVGPGGASLTSVAVPVTIRSIEIPVGGSDDGGGGGDGDGGGGGDPGRNDPDDPENNNGLWWEPGNVLDTGGTSPDETSEMWAPSDSGSIEARKTYWNPPLISLASGAYVPVRVSGLRGTSGVQFKQPPTRVSLLGSGDYEARIRRKGYIMQDLREQWLDRFKASGTADNNSTTTTTPTSTTDGTSDQRQTGNAPDEGTDDTAPEDNPTDTPTPASDYNWSPGEGLRYGFRFHYNPTSIAFGTSYMDQGVDPGAISSGADSSFPMGDESQSSTVALNLILNRVDDLSVIQYDGSNARITPSSLYGGQGLDQEQLINLATRGTMYDLEYLFRTVTGKPVMTDFRGMTADHGMIYGVPVILHLGPRMTYWGLVRSIGYNHEYFNENMTPMITSVTISFQRMPDWTGTTDVQGASQQEDE